MNKQFFVYLGNYGSGKTELALNQALRCAAQGLSTVLLDMDIVNPYFRSSEHKAMLNQRGIRVIAPVFANTNVDVPSLLPDVQSVFVDGTQAAIFDVGGDAVGATAMGRYKGFFEAQPQVKTYFVVNTCRPRTQTTHAILALMADIIGHARLAIDGLILNSNLGPQSSVQELLDGLPILQEVQAEKGIPIVHIAGQPEILEEFDRCTDGAYASLLLPVQRFMALEY